MKSLVYKAIAGIIFCSIVPAVMPPAYALKKRVFAPAKTKPVKAIKAPSVSYSQVKVSKATHSVIATFLNPSAVSRVEYTLNYTANGIPQGVVGSIIAKSGIAETRDLYFGTCSKGVCTPHTSISNASLMIATSLKSGAIHRKRYVIKNI